MHYLYVPEVFVAVTCMLNYCFSFCDISLLYAFNNCVI